MDKCPICHGQGQYTVQEHDGNFTELAVEYCWNCEGTGNITTDAGEFSIGEDYELND